MTVNDIEYLTVDIIIIKYEKKIFTSKILFTSC